MKLIKGDLIQLALAGTFDVIVHGCNCQCSMGAGIAKSIRETFPEAYEADCQTTVGDRSKLGAISVASIVRPDLELVVVNGYTQVDFSGPGQLVSYDAVRSVMRLVRERFGGKRIGYPRIGAGLAKGDWDKISRIIDEELGLEDHTVVEYVIS